MSNRWMSKLVIVPLLALVLLGLGTVAASANKGTTQGPSMVATAATVIGISEANLQAGLKAGQTVAQIAVAHNVSAQKVIDAVVAVLTTQAQAQPTWAKMPAAQQTRTLAAIRDQATRFVNTTQRGTDKDTQPTASTEIQVAAKTIGVSVADLQSAIKSGKSIAQVAAAHNVSAQTVIDAIVADLTAKAQAQPNWAKQPEGQKAQALTAIRTRATNLVNNTNTSKEGKDAPKQVVVRTEFTVAAATIGVTTTELQNALKAGQTIAQVAQAHGVSADKVINAIVAELTAKAQAQPTWAKMAEAQKTRTLTAIRDQATRLVTTVQTGDKKDK